MLAVALKRSRSKTGGSWAAVSSQSVSMAGASFTSFLSAVTRTCPGDTRASMVANVVGHYAVGLPVGISLGLGMDLGATGVWLGLSAGLTAVAVRARSTLPRATTKRLA